MIQRAALIGFLGFIAWLFWRDVRRRPSVSAASWLVVMWAVIFASRPVSEWFQSAAAMTPDAYLEGSPTDRIVYLLLIFAGYGVLFWRRVSVVGLIRRNGWLFAFYAFWAVSILWSDYPFVAFKRWFKDFGGVIMVLVLLTEDDPIDAAKAVLLRTVYLLVPLSVLFIRYYPELGRGYFGFNRDELMYVGVATHKNTLGALLLVGAIVLVWDFVTRTPDRSGRRSNLSRVDNLIVFCMCLWLLRIANSATSTACTIIGLGVYSAVRVGAVRRNLRFVEFYALGGIAVWFALDQILNITEFVIVSLGRDMSLTTRADAWPFLLSQDINPLVGAGFKSFWAGDRMARVWIEFPGIVQAHNGYIETYLEGGLLGLLFLLGMLVSSFRKIKGHLIDGDDWARVRFAFLLIALFYNFSEASFSQLSLLWFVTQLILVENVNPASASVTTLASPTRAMKVRDGAAPNWTPIAKSKSAEFADRDCAQGKRYVPSQRHSSPATGQFGGRFGGPR